MVMNMNFFSSLSPIHRKEEEVEPVIIESGEELYLPVKESATTHNGPAKTVIAEGMNITGTVNSQGDVDIFGVVHGNVISSGKVMVVGLVEGDVKAREILISASHFKGNLTSEELLIIESNSTVEGDVKVRDFHLDGNLIGDVSALGSTVLRNTAVLTGNVSTGTLEITKGAVVNGSVTIKK